jgi:hypothetical protein
MGINQLITVGTANVHSFFNDQEGGFIYGLKVDGSHLKPWLWKIHLLHFVADLIVG